MGSWRLTGIYGEPNRNNRWKTWDLLRTLARDSNLPWCLVGDFNNVVSQRDKKRGDPYPTMLVDGFNKALADAGLVDMDIVGHQYTWERSRGKPEWTEVRLDRAVVTENWLEDFPLAKLYNLEGSTSDHSPIILMPKKSERIQIREKFKFENAWLVDPMCTQLVKESWEDAADSDIQQKLRKCGEVLKEWGKEVTSNFGDKIKKYKDDLKRYRGGSDAESLQRYDEAKYMLHKVLDQREIFWRQRSK
ncbi:uncharacterized protein LOC141664821 [Apium graveolens]|uniref:uncharacterized protein LOC141664821 n=1 Tax=Apium graveolens TaxID=4045 RepID=UPI003D79D314